MRTKTFAGITAFRMTPTRRIPAIITTVIQGTPCRDTLPKAAGAWPCRESPKRMRPAPKMSLLMAERAAVITTAFRMCGAAGMPSPLNLHEGAAVAVDFIPRKEAHEHSQRQNIEQQDAHRDGIDCLGDDFLRVRGLAGRDAQCLDTAKGEHHHREGCQQVSLISDDVLFHAFRFGGVQPLTRWPAFP